MMKGTLRSACVAAVMALMPMTAIAQDQTQIDLEAAGGMNELIEKAQAEGSLLIYGAPSAEKMVKWLEGFTEKYGIEAQYFRGPTNTINQRFEQEQRAGKNLADVIAVSDLSVIKTGRDNGNITEYTPSNAADYPDNTILAGYAYPLYLSASNVGWNTRVVPEDLQEALFEDPLKALLDPRLKGKIAITDLTAGGSQIGTNANIIYNQEDEYGWDYMAKLAEQDPAVIRSSTVILDHIIAGDYWATTDAYTSLFGGAAVAGAPVAFQAPDIAAVSIFYTAVANNAPHPHAARLFTEWALSPEGQDSIAVIGMAESAMAGWVDNRDLKKLEWFRPAKTFYTEWRDDERLQGDALLELYARWNENFGR